MDELATILKRMLGSFQNNAEDGPPIDVMGNINVNDEDCGVNLAGVQEACQPLYLGAHSTKPDDIMLLMNICTIHGVNNKFVDELLSRLHKHLFPQNNCLPSNMYHAKTLIRKLGLNYKLIHACPNGCVSFQGVYANPETCSKCGLARYKDVG